MALLLFGENVPGCFHERFWPFHDRLWASLNENGYETVRNGWERSRFKNEIFSVIKNEEFSLNFLNIKNMNFL